MNMFKFKRKKKEKEEMDGVWIVWKSDTIIAVCGNEETALKIFEETLWLYDYDEQQIKIAKEKMYAEIDEIAIEYHFLEK